MQIAIYHNLPSGGAKRALYEWVKRLSVNHTMDVYSLSNPYHSFLDIQSFVNNYIIKNFNSKKIFKSPLGRLNQFQRWQDLRNLAYVGESIADEINKGGYDVLFIQPCMFTFVPTFIHLITIPSVYYLHEPFGKTYRQELYRTYLKQNIWRRLIDRVDPLLYLYNFSLKRVREMNIRKTTLLLANSKFTQQCMQRDYSLEVPVCYCGVDCDTFRPLSYTKKEHVVLSVGELTPRKGFDFLIKSLALIPPDIRPTFRLISNLIDDSERKYLESLASESQVHLELLFNLNTEEIVVEYNKAMIVGFSPLAEPFGLVPVESMACGTPVIGVREGGFQEAIIHGHTGFLVDRDPLEFASAIAFMLSKPELAQEFGHNGRIHVLKNWTWEKSISILEPHLIECANLEG
jgi:glycosyltransferase involved in cell wall biosynthesis